MDKKVFIRLSEDKEKAYLMLYAPENPGEQYSFEEIMNILKEEGIIYGVDKERIKAAVEHNHYYSELLIAKGISPAKGTDGFYQYTFDTKKNNKPIILEDGSVDYNTLGQIQICKEGELLATYFPAVEGNSGVNVLGKEILPKPVKDLPKLQGKGFEVKGGETETQYYTAKYDGKVELNQGKLVVSELFVVNGDVDNSTGNVFFRGDVLVTGNVFSNVTIEAKGNIIVNGHVETATLKAGKDVILRNGMQGSGKGAIYAGGEVSAKFFEQSIVIAKGTINANAILNCDIDSDLEIVVSGKRGAIIGGIVRAGERITATMIGNRAQAATSVIVGADEHFKSNVIVYERTIKKWGERMGELDKRLSVTKNEREKNLLLEQREICHVNIEENLKKKVALLERKERGTQGTISVKGTLNKNVTIVINGANLIMKDNCKNVYLKEKKGTIHIYTNL